MLTGALARQLYKNAETAAMTSRTDLAPAGWSPVARQIASRLAGLVVRFGSGVAMEFD
jgi:hypothetical protein